MLTVFVHMFTVHSNQRWTPFRFTVWTKDSDAKKANQNNIERRNGMNYSFKTIKVYRRIELQCTKDCKIRQIRSAVFPEG